jgi:hypothetical protein
MTTLAIVAGFLWDNSLWIIPSIMAIYATPAVINAGRTLRNVGAGGFYLAESLVSSSLKLQSLTPDADSDRGDFLLHLNDVGVRFQCTSENSNEFTMRVSFETKDM